MYRRVLVPLDGTRFGDHALPYAVAIAAKTGAMLELAHVHHHQELDPDLAALPQYHYQHIEEADVRHEQDELTTEEQSLEERAADLEARYGVRVVTRVLHGATAEALWVEARDTVADLIVLATHARQGFQRMRFGSVASELVQHLNVPALCIRPANPSAPLVAPRLRRALIALDGSDFSEQVVTVVAPLARALDMEVTLVHVVAANPAMVTGMSDMPRFLPHREEARVYLSHVADRLAGRMNVTDIVAVENGEPAAALAGMLEKGGYDTMAMATHGRSGLTRMFMGSVAEDVVRRTTRPVLLYRPRLHGIADVDLTEAFRMHGV